MIIICINWNNKYWYISCYFTSSTFPWIKCLPIFFAFFPFSVVLCVFIATITQAFWLNLFLPFLKPFLLLSGFPVYIQVKSMWLLSSSLLDLIPFIFINITWTCFNNNQYQLFLSSSRALVSPSSSSFSAFFWCFFCPKAFLIIFSHCNLTLPINNKHLTMWNWKKAITFFSFLHFLFSLSLFMIIFTLIICHSEWDEDEPITMIIMLKWEDWMIRMQKVKQEENYAFHFFFFFFSFRYV